MTVRIRLRRTGATKQPSYRLVVTDSKAPRDGRFNEILGYYSPLSQPATIKVDEAKVREWLAKGAQPTESVQQLLRRAGIEVGSIPTAR